MTTTKTTSLADRERARKGGGLTTRLRTRELGRGVQSLSRGTAALRVVSRPEPSTAAFYLSGNAVLVYGQEAPRDRPRAASEGKRAARRASRTRAHGRLLTERERGPEGHL